MRTCDPKILSVPTTFPYPVLRGQDVFLSRQLAYDAGLKRKAVVCFALRKLKMYMVAGHVSRGQSGAQL